MLKSLLSPRRCFCGVALVFAAFGSDVPSLEANPSGGTVVRGTATFNASGPQLTISTSDRAAINWQSFNIGVGQTTTFVQPSASSVVWNQINDPNPSQILGNLNANGYVVLQNSSGFYIGGQAVINAHGLVMSTAATPIPDFSSGSAWQFSAPPPTASIINYGLINMSAGGSVFLIASDIQNHGIISAPQGNIGLYAGQEVLMSERPDGRGLTATVKLPEGSVDNTGKLIADGGTIAMHAQVVNQGGLIQANSIQNKNGIIELFASDAINLGSSSVISARGDSVGASAGGSVTIKSDNTYSDQPASTINISGGSKGGNGGQLEISAASLDGIQSAINARAAAGFHGGEFTIDPVNLTLNSAFVSSLTPAFGSGLYRISLQADNNITLCTLWSLTDPGAAALLSLNAGNSIILNTGSGIKAGNNWSVNLLAGTALASGSTPASGSDGIYVNGNSFVQTLNGNITLSAANELLVKSGAIRTLNGGNISVATQYGDVNTGSNYKGYVFAPSASVNNNAPPYYKVDSANLGGISTAAGGNVTITAGGSVISYLPTQNDYDNNGSRFNGGTGAFGSQAGNVTIVAGGNVSGNYVVANGVGSITAGGDIGVPSAGTISKGFALSLIKGSWSVYAPHGNIYLQDVLNPNGIFNDVTESGLSDDAGNAIPYAGYHLFDYDPHASVLLNAGKSVEITGSGAPLKPESNPDLTMPILLPPSLKVVTGSGDFVLDADVTLFPSAFGNLNITSGRNFLSLQDPNNTTDVNTFRLQMSDSGSRQWLGSDSFGIGDHAAAPLQVASSTPVEISVVGNMENVNIHTTKATQITVGGDLKNSGFVGENLASSGVMGETFIHVAGAISYSPIYTFQGLGQAIVGANPLNPSEWNSIFSLLVDNDKTASYEVPANSSAKTLLADANSLRIFKDTVANPGFVYDLSSLQLGFQYQMPQYVHDALVGSSSISALSGKLQIIKLDPFGNPVIQSGQTSLGQDPGKNYFATTTVSFAPRSVIDALYGDSLHSVKDATSLSPGLQTGGPGKFNITAASLNLGASGGIVSWGIASGLAGSIGVNYASLAGVTDSGAAINLTVAGDIGMLTSTIASFDGGDVNVTSTGGKIDLGLASLPIHPVNAGNNAFGIYTSGHSDVHVTASKNINIESARIATFNGGSVFVTSLDGNVNAGNGANETLVMPIVYLDPITGFLTTGTIQNPKPYGSGILAISPTTQWQTPGGNLLPGNITVETPHGDIVSTLGGISQYALNGSIAGGPTITLTAGTKAPDGTVTYPGNILLGAGGVVGGTVNITAQGRVEGLIVSRQDSSINAAQSFSGTVLSGGTANLSAGGTISGTVVGIGGVSASGGLGVTADILGQNVSLNGGAAQSTLGTSATATASSQSAAQQANSDTKEQVASNASEDDDEKKKKGKGPLLTRRTSRVTVILPSKS